LLTVDFRLFPVKSGERVLDVGCGAGRHSWHVCSLDHCYVYSMDIDLESLLKAKYMFQEMEKDNLAKGKWNLILGNTMRLPFKDGSFDKIICSEVLEHVIDDEQGVRELLRVLKDGGELAVSVPTWLSETICWAISEAYHTNPGGHIRIYHASKLIDLLERNKFKVYAVRHKHAYHSVYWLLRCLFGVRNERALVPAIYHKFLVWEMDNNRHRNRIFQRSESFFDNFFPKSLVVYLRKEPQQKAVN